MATHLSFDLEGWNPSFEVFPVACLPTSFSSLYLEPGVLLKLKISMAGHLLPEEKESKQMSCSSTLC